MHLGASAHIENRIENRTDAPGCIPTSVSCMTPLADTVFFKHATFRIMNFSNNNDQGQIFSIGHIELGEPKRKELNVDPTDVPILPTRNVVLFPNVTIPIARARDFAAHS